MNVTLKLTLDGLVRALRWRQIDYLESPARQMSPVDNPIDELDVPFSQPKPGDQDVQ